MTEPTIPPTEPTTPANPVTPPTTEVPAKVTFTPEQQAAIDALIGTARKEGKAAAEAKAQEAKDAADAARTRADQEAKGEYEVAKKALEGERDGFKNERDTLNEKVGKYEALTKSRVDALKKDLPAEALEDFPETEDALYQLTWLESRKALIAKIAPQQGTVTRLVATPSTATQAAPAVRSLIPKSAF